MPLNTLVELRDALLRLHLVSAEKIDECMTRLSAKGAQPADFLRVLEQLHYLTPYQVGRLKAGETEGLVLGNYKLLYRNAAGSYARVFRACAVDDNRMVGLKVLRDRWATDAFTVGQFHREAELGMRLHHKNIVPIYEVRSQGDFHFFTMEFVEGGNLRDFIKIRKKLAPPEATHCILDMCEGLDYALGMGITHRDLKLTNVLMNMRGVSKLVDFGLAGDAEQFAHNAEVEGAQRALEYAALEKGTHAPLNDPRSDLYFVGTIFYELLSGVPPYPRTRSRKDRLQLARYQNIRPLRSLEPNMPRPALEIVERLMRIDLDQRYQRPIDVITDLYTALDEIGEPAPTSTTPSNEPTNNVAPGPAERHLPTVMCIENRPKQQNRLREYLSKRGFRVLVLNDLGRGLSRLKSNPPDCIILMGAAIGRGIVKAFQQAVDLGEATSVVTLAVLAENQGRWQRKLTETRRARVLVQPITLRDLRREIHLAFHRRNRDARGRSSRHADAS